MQGDKNSILTMVGFLTSAWDYGAPAISFANAVIDNMQF